jgi:hypothetical protein
MHGSGASTVAGVLGSLGCELPASTRRGSEAASASFESRRIQDFNDELLASAGSAWDDFTPFHRDWLRSPRAPEFLERAVALLEEEFRSADLFLLSDPRISRIIPFWAEALKQFGCVQKPILITRDPMQVARLLNSEKGSNEPLIEMAWLRHMLDAEFETRGMDRVHLSFEQLLRGWEAEVGKTQDNLQVVWPKSLASAEFEVAALLNKIPQRPDGALVGREPSALQPGWLLETFQILERWALNGEQAGDHPTLDRIRSEFNVASSAFARVIRGALAASQAPFQSGMSQAVRANTLGGAPTAAQTVEVNALKTMLQEQRRKTTLLEADIQSHIEARDAIEAQLHEAQAEIEAHRARRKEMARVITNREAKIARLNEEIAARYEELAALQRHMMRSSPLWVAKIAIRRLARGGARTAKKSEKAYS